MLFDPAKLETRYIPEPNSGCWIWLGAVNRQGHGHLQHNKKWWQAHAFFYTVLKKAIPDGLVLDHLCRVRCCCNPEHLEPVTQYINILRGESPFAINARKTHCPHGHSLGDAYVVSGHRKCRRCQITRSVARNRRLRQGDKL